MTYTPRIAASVKASTLIDLLRLIRSENVGPVTFFALLRQFSSAREALEAMPSLARQGGRRMPLACFSAQQAEAEITALTKAGGRFISIADDDYPPLLSTIYDPPPLLSVLGHTHLWKQAPSLAVVGARNASATGCQFARKLAQEAGAKGWVVTSGLARGIDTAAHTGALATGTVAVMASGIGQIYPPENRTLHDTIARQGCVLTEQPFNAPPHSRAFPGRNRIISGISRATLLVEAAVKSGSLITAKFALDQNREVFAVPGSPLDPRCKGTNQLLKQGAHLCESFEDILLNVPQHRPQLGESATQDYLPPARTASSAQEQEAARHIVTGKLGYSPVQIDELQRQCEVSYDLMALVLLELELAGRLTRHPGHKVALSMATEVSNAG